MSSLLVNGALVFLSCFSVASAAANIPDYVSTYAPLVYLNVNELYYPSDISAQISNSIPELNFTPVATTESLGLSSLADLNSFGNCTVDDFGDCFVYLTSKDNTTTDPAWLHGTLPNSSGVTEGATSCAVVVVDHGSGLVDAFYFYFYAFNLGLPLLGHIEGNHVGDWEHSMVRFQNGTPQSIWLSAHGSGDAYTYNALSKNGSRPIIYSAIGDHANYATLGTHGMQDNVDSQIIILFNDTTSKGPLWDPIASAFFYTFTPLSSDNGTFVAGTNTPNAPIDWLYFAGKWGDKQYNSSNPAQFSFLGVAFTWVDGPSGPLDKDLNRTQVCPDNITPCSTTTVLPAVTGDPTPSQTISRTKTASAVGTSTLADAQASSTSNAGSSALQLRNAPAAIVAANLYYSYMSSPP